MLINLGDWGYMGHWLSKKDYQERAIRIVELRDKERLQFKEIAERMSVSPGVVGYSYYKSKKRGLT